jgi:hypothetical protein
VSSTKGVSKNQHKKAYLERTACSFLSVHNAPETLSRACPLGNNR